jgi:hypothetical protein
MTARRTPAPKGLDPRGRAFWRTVQASYELDPAETELLVEVCRTLDLAERLQGVLEDAGLVAAGSVGQPRVHPAVGELRAARALLGRLLAQLELPDPESGSTLASPGQAKARKAAKARWAPSAEIRELRRHGAPPAS